MLFFSAILSTAALMGAVSAFETNCVGADGELKPDSISCPLVRRCFCFFVSFCHLVAAV
jgi:hypothetical protein